MEVLNHLQQVVVLVGAIVLVFSALACAAAKWLWFRPKEVERLLKQQGLSANPYRFFIGDVGDGHRILKRTRSTPMDFSHDIIRRSQPLFHHIINKHGNNSFAWLGPIPMVFITEPEQIREVYSRWYDFPKPTLKLLRLISPGIVGTEGETWTRTRKVVSPVFHMERLKFMVPAFYESCINMMVRWENKMSETETSGGSLELDVLPDFRSLTGDAISRAAFSSSYEEGRQIFELISQQFQLIGSILHLIIIPGWRFLPIEANKRMMQMDKEIDDLVKGVVDKRIMQIETAEEDSKVRKDQDDMLSVLLESCKKHKTGSLDVDEIVAECKLFYFAGQETISLLLSWTMILLSKHQDWQVRARDEVLNTFGRRRKPDYAGLNNLKIVTMILYEVLRLYPPLDATNRQTTKDCKLGSLSLPPGVLVHLPVSWVHRDPDIWAEDAMEFNPERFSEGISRATGGKMAFFPFGWGPRICAGQNVALLEAKMVITMILQRFSFELSPSYVHAPSPVIFLQPQFGAQIILYQL